MRPAELDAYFERLAYRGRPGPDLDTLRALCRLHVEAIPFENIDVLLGRRISVEPRAVFAKLVTERRGGYCFEQNTLLGAALEALGFEVEYRAARARVGRARHETPPRTHLALQVNLHGEAWLVDAGLGGLSPTAPIRWVEDLVQTSPHEPRRLVREGGRWFHQARLGDAWADVCELGLEPMPPVDREIANWYASTHPDSGFRGRLMVARATSCGGRITLSDTRLTMRDVTVLARRELSGPEDLREVLAEQFGLALPRAARWPGWLFASARAQPSV